MNAEELKLRTKQFAINIIKFFDSISSDSKSLRIIQNQLIRSATSVAANYRAACRSRSKSEFISKIKIVEEESDESQFWIELLIESGIVRKEKIEFLLIEATHLTKIFSASAKTAKTNK